MKFATRLSVLAGVLLAAACDATPTAPALEQVSAPAAAAAERFSEEYVLDVTGFEFTFYCEDGSTSEPVVMSGRIRETVTGVVLPDGSLRLSYRARGEDLAGVGAETGDVYTVFSQFQDGTRDGNGFDLRYRERFRMRNTRTHDTFDVVVGGRVSFDPDWNLIVSRERLRVSCPASA